MPRRASAVVPIRPEDRLNLSAKKRVTEVCTSGHPYSYMRSVGQASSRPSIRVRSQSSTSSSTHPTLFGPSCTRLGNRPAFSRRATCCGEYRTNSFSWGFESILITISPSLKSIAMPKVTTLPRQRKGSSPQFGWREARFQVKQFEYLNSAQVEEVSKNAFKEKFQSLLRA
jgi:hypothetical protein